jgi:hypothetical protein
MTLAVSESPGELDHPLDMLEHTVEENGWPFAGAIITSALPGARICNRCTSA